MRLPASLAPLREPAFRLLWTGQAVSAMGDSLVPVALAFSVLRVGGSASSLGLVLAGFTLAQVAFLLVGGVWADRLPRQLIMLVSDAIRAVSQGALAMLLITGKAQLWELAAGAIVYGSAAAFFRPASTALVPQTVSAAELQQANALMGLSRSVVQVAGPAVSGILVALVGPGWVFAVDAVTFVVSAGSLAQLRVAATASPQRSRFLTELHAGWSELSKRKWYSLNLCSHALWNFAIAAFFVLGPVIAARRLGGASAWGLVAASLSLGSVVGGVVALRLRPKRPLVAANLALTPAGLMLVALSFPAPTIVIASTAVIGFVGLTFLNEVWSATMQQLIPADVMARVSSYDWLISLIAMPAGYAVAGPLADWLGPQATLVLEAAVLAIPSFLIVLVPGVRRIRRTDDGRIVESEPAMAAS